jgi:GDP-L-fucose synthase
MGKNLTASALASQYELVAPAHAELDLMNEDAVLEYVRNGHFDVILHAAAKPGHRAARDPSGIFCANTRIFFNLSRAIDEVSRMIVLGSGAIYDSRFYHPFMKEEEFGFHVPADEHGFSKYVIQQYISRDRRFVDLRLFSVFGRYEEYSIRFISNMIYKALFNLPLTMHQNRRFSYLFVEDLPAIVTHFIENTYVYDAYNVTPRRLDVAN